MTPFRYGHHVWKLPGVICYVVTKMPVSASDADCGGRQVQRGGPAGAEELPGRDWGHVRPKEAPGPRGSGRRHRRQEEVDAKLWLRGRRAVTRTLNSSKRLTLRALQVCRRQLSICIPALKSINTAPLSLPSLSARRSSGHGSARVLGSRYRRRRRRRALVNFLERNWDRRHEARVSSSIAGNDEDVAICYCNIWRTERRTVLECTHQHACNVLFLVRVTRYIYGFGSRTFWQTERKQLRDFSGIKRKLPLYRTLLTRDALTRPYAGCAKTMPYTLNMLWNWETRNCRSNSYSSGNVRSPKPSKYVS